MKRSKINQLIKDSGVLGFKFGNKTESHSWFVALADGKMLAKHVFSRGATVRNFYYNVPYELMGECEDIYREIVIDFVDCYAIDWQNLTAGESGVFRSVASADDDGLLELLSFFGVNYDEFLLDVFYWYGCWVEYAFLVDGDIKSRKPADGACDSRSYTVSNRTEKRLSKRVLIHLPCTGIVFSYDDGIDESWHFTLAHGELWYGHVTSDQQTPLLFEEYGHVNPSDEDAVGAIRDAVLSNEGCGVVSFETFGESEKVFDILGFRADDFMIE